MLKNKGITLIALVVTIVVLLILAGVSITAVFGDNGIISGAQKAKEKTDEAVKNDYEQIEDLEGIIATYSITSDGSYSEKKKVNTPKLGSGMIPITWQAENEEGTQGKWVVPKNEDEWYDYQNKKWANAKTADGSMWVWIPRYAYSIAEENYNKNVEGTIDIDFMKGTTNESASGRTTWNNKSGAGNWNIHPAFEFGETVPGIWVAKFKASHTGCTTDVSTGMTDTNRTDLTLQVKPNVTSWRNITIGNAFTVCLNYNKSLNSHLIKNVEWGAVLYLTQSKYGKNSKLLGNECESKITGAGSKIEGDVMSENGQTYLYDNSFETKHSYMTENGKEASTTGNIYGIYDMSGSYMYEFVAAYINQEEDVGKNGSSLLDAGSEEDTKKLVDIYETSERKTMEDNWNVNKNRYGDALYETSGEYNGHNAWYGDYGGYFYNESVFLARGNCSMHDTIYEPALFYFYGKPGANENNRFFQTSSNSIIRLYRLLSNFLLRMEC